MGTHHLKQAGPATTPFLSQVHRYASTGTAHIAESTVELDTGGNTSRMALPLRGLPILPPLALNLVAGVIYDQTPRLTTFDSRIPVKLRVPSIEPPVFDIPATLYSPQFEGPPVSTFKIVIEGDRLAVIGKDMTEIFDLTARTVTFMRKRERTYTVVTLAEAEHRRLEMVKRWSSRNRETYTAEVQKTGQTRQLASQTAEEYRVIAIGTLHGRRRVAASSVYWIVPKAPLPELAAFQATWASQTTLPFPGMPGRNGRSAFAAMAEAESKLPGYVLSYVVESRPPANAPAVTPTPLNYDASGPEMASQPPSISQSMFADEVSKIRATETSFSGFADRPVDASVFSVPAGYKPKKGPVFLP